jgi:hypothetical protein
MYQNGEKYTKRPQNILNFLKTYHIALAYIYQMAIKIPMCPLQGLPKISKLGFLV